MKKIFDIIYLYKIATINIAFLPNKKLYRKRFKNL